MDIFDRVAAKQKPQLTPLPPGFQLEGTGQMPPLPAGFQFETATPPPAGFFLEVPAEAAPATKPRSAYEDLIPKAGAPRANPYEDLIPRTPAAPRAIGRRSAPSKGDIFDRIATPAPPPSFQAPTITSQPPSVIKDATDVPSSMMNSPLVHIVQDMPKDELAKLPPIRQNLTRAGEQIGHGIESLTTPSTAIELGPLAAAGKVGLGILSAIGATQVPSAYREVKTAIQTPPDKREPGQIGAAVGDAVNTAAMVGLPLLGLKGKPTASEVPKAEAETAPSRPTDKPTSGAKANSPSAAESKTGAGPKADVKQESALAATIRQKVAKPATKKQITAVESLEKMAGNKPVGGFVDSILKGETTAPEGALEHIKQLVPKSQHEAFDSQFPAKGPGMIGLGGAREGVPMSEQGGPAEPKQAAANIVGAPTSTDSATRIIPTIRDALHGVGTLVRGLAGESMPKTTAANREVGEMGVRYASSRIAARPLAQTFANRVLEGTGVDPVKFGAALVEDNLASIREDLREKAAKAHQEGNEEEAAKFDDQADQVKSIIGTRNSPFRTQSDYFDYLEQPEVKHAIANHKQAWSEIIEPQFKQAQNIDPDVQLPSRGRQTDARINLKAVFKDDGVSKPVTSGSSLTSTFQRKSPFGISAKGTGKTYEISYPEIIAHTFERQLEIANKRAYDAALVKNGLAVIDKPGQKITIGGEETVPFPISRKTMVVDQGGEPKVFTKAENLYIKKSLAQEYRTASNVDPKAHIPIFTPVAHALNKAALAGLTDFTVHTSNLGTALFNRPTYGSLLKDSILSATGRADILPKLYKVWEKSRMDNHAQLAELAQIGALRGEVSKAGVMGWTGNLLRSFDKNVRLVLDDTYKALVKEGLVEDTETNRREFINAVGQYNRRLQGPVVKALRDTGVGPFVTAGRSFGVMGAKMATLSPGVKSSGLSAEALLRANVASKWVGAAVFAGTINYLLTHDKGGGVMGRPGTPIGKIDTGRNDSNGRPELIPAFDLIGLGRALRVTGVGPYVDSKRIGLNGATARDNAIKTIANTAIGPVAGPPVKFGFTLASGNPPAIGVGRSAPVAAPGESQFLQNTKEAFKEVNPLIQSAVEYGMEKKPLTEALARQWPRFSMQPGKPADMVRNYPKIVTIAQSRAFIDDVVHRARSMGSEQRKQFLQDSINRLPNSEKSYAEIEFRRRIRAH